MRAFSFLPAAVLLLSAFNPIALAQDTGTDGGTDTGGDTGATDPNAGGDTGATDGGDTGESTNSIVPSEPSGSTVTQPGQNLTASWALDTSGTWTAVKIQLMTGSNQQMVALTDVGNNIDGTTVGSYSFVVPNVTPYSQIYFLQFTNPGVTQALWTTRFTIAGPDGNTTAPPNTEVVNGTNVGWGIGALSDATVPTSSSRNTLIPTGAGGTGVTVYRDSVNTAVTIPEGVQNTGVAMATNNPKGPGSSVSGATNAARPAAAACVLAVLAGAAILA